MHGWRLLWLCVGALLLAARCQEEEEEHNPNIESMPIGDEYGDDPPDGEENEPLMDGPDGGELFTDNDVVYAQSQVTVEQLEGLHGKIDKDGDGKVSMPEIIDFSKATRKAIAERDANGVLEDLDVNKDGKVSHTEFYNNNQFAPAPPPEGLSDEEQDAERAKMEDAQRTAQMHKNLEMSKFQLADQNGDGFLVIEELPAALYPETHDGVLALTAAFTLKLRDKDEDGELSQDELWEPDRSEDEETREDTLKEQSDTFQKLDKDRSGKLNVEEIKAWESGAFHTSENMKHLFENADKDKDKHITLEEFKSSQEPIHAAPDVTSYLLEWADHHEL